MPLPDLGAPRRALQRAMFAVAGACLGTFVAAHGESLLYEAVESRRLDSSREGGSVAADPPKAPARTATAGARAVPVRRATAKGPPREVIGRLDIPRLGLRAIVARGIDARTLRRSAGHVPGTARPGEPGNVGIAAHRDLHFRRLEGVKTGDRVRLVTTDGAYEYTVESAEVVDPHRVDLLDPTPEPTLTLVTCHPFSMIGNAPRRFVVRARQVVGPDGS